MDNLGHSYLKNTLFMEKIRSLSRLQPFVFGTHILLNWAVIISCWVAWHQLQNVWAWPFLAFIIATRQHALGLLVHDIAHFRFLKSTKLGDLICNLFIAFPLLYNVQEYRRHHLNHHKYLNTDLDPDWMQKAGRKEYATPMSRAKLIRRLLWATRGGGLYEMARYLLFFYKKNMKKKESNASIKMLGITLTQWMTLYYIVALTIMVMTGTWKIYLIMWLAPALTLLMGLLELRSLTEHIGMMDDDSHYGKTRTVKVGRVEGFCINPHNSHYHLEHHMFPSVPFYNLPATHKLLMSTEEYKNRAHVAETYFGSGPSSAVGQIENASTSKSEVRNVVG